MEYCGYSLQLLSLLYTANYDVVCSLILAAITLLGHPWERSSTKVWLREPAVLQCKLSCQITAFELLTVSECRWNNWPYLWA